MFRTKFNNKYVNKLPIATPIAVADYFSYFGTSKKILGRLYGRIEKITKIYIFFTH